MNAHRWLLFVLLLTFIVLTAGAGVRTITASQSQDFPSIILVSRNSDGVPGDDNSGHPSVSAGGRFVAFGSDANNLADDEIASTNVFVRDLQTGQTELVSRHSNGAAADADSYAPSLSADGRYVAFDSFAANLVDDDTVQCDPYCRNVFVHDLQTGETTLVSRNSAGEPGNGPSGSAVISADSRYVAFGSTASNLAEGDDAFCGATRCLQVFVHDRLTGETSVVSRSTDGELGNGHSYPPVISADGRYLAFTSLATNLTNDIIEDCDGNVVVDQCGSVFVHDRQTGETTIVTRGPDGESANGPSDNPALSADGRYVAFDSWADNLTHDDTQLCGEINRYSCLDVFVHDRQTGRTVLVSRHSDGAPGMEDSRVPSLSADGRYIAFVSEDYTLGTRLIPYGYGIVFRDLVLGTTTMIFAGSYEDFTGSPSISSSGRFVVFQTYSGSLVPDDPIRCHDLTGMNSCADVFLYDHGPVGHFAAYTPLLAAP